MNPLTEATEARLCVHVPAGGETDTAIHAALNAPADAPELFPVKIAGRLWRFLSYDLGSKRLILSLTAI